MRRAVEKVAAEDTVKDEDQRVVPVAARRVPVQVRVRVGREEMEVISRAGGSIGSTESIDLGGMIMGVDM